MLSRLFAAHAPCLILIDEWVAYLRQIYKVDGLPSGSFDANLSFVQSLTEAVKASPRTLLVASLPASQIEVGGEGGQEALARLKQTFARVESSWRPASQEESYEIVRRRLFQDIAADAAPHRDNAVRQFAKLYREAPGDFPQGVADEDYRRKLDRAYPIHPELFDQLYTAWGSLEKFQRTRGVLRLMAQAIHELWIGSDPSVMIMPGSVAVGSERVEPELLHYLEPAWSAIIAGDVDGPASLPMKIDQGAPNLARYSATRRIARTVFLGTAPLQGGERGMDDRQINLGCVQPGERPAIFGDALRRLTNEARFLHADMGRHWYTLSASLNRVAADRASQLDDAEVVERIDRDLRRHVEALRGDERGHFALVHAVPASSADVPDEAEGVRAVVLGVLHPHGGGKADTPARAEAADIFAHRGNGPRVNRNGLVFVAADARAIDTLREGVRLALAWEKVVAETDRLNLSQSDAALAKARVRETAETAQARLREAWCHVLYPVQDEPIDDVTWETARFAPQSGLLAGASKKLLAEGALYTEIGDRNLQSTLAAYIWQDKPHLLVADVWEYVSRHVYMPRLASRDVLRRAIEGAVSRLEPGGFAFAQGFDARAGYAGLMVEGAAGGLVIDREALIVDAAVAAAHRPAARTAATTNGAGFANGPSAGAPEGGADAPAKPHAPTRFTGTVLVPAERPLPLLNKVIEGIVEQLTMLPDCDVTIKLEILADAPSGLDRDKVRTLIENANTIGFQEREVR